MTIKDIKKSKRGREAPFVVYMLFFLVLTPLVEPAEVLAMPHHGILWLEDPVIFIREDQQTRRYSHHLSSIERRHSLIHRHSVVHTSMNYHQRSVPVAHELMRRKLIMTLGLGQVAPR